MNKLSKRRAAISKQIEPAALLSLDDALEAVKQCATAKFVERIDVAIQLGIDPRKSDQVVRGASVLPHGTGKVVRVAVFAQGEQADKARAAGADVVGFEDLAEQVKKGELPFDVVIAAPDAMRVVGQLGQVLGPRGLMPNPKVGTVTSDVETAVRNAKGGQVRYRADKSGILHCTVGDAKFEIAALKDNLMTLLTDLKKLKPAAAKGIYFKKMVFSSTMGPGIRVDLSMLDT